MKVCGAGEEGREEGVEGWAFWAIVSACKFHANIGSMNMLPWQFKNGAWLIERVRAALSDRALIRWVSMLDETVPLFLYDVVLRSCSFFMLYYVVALTSVQQ